MNIDLIYCARCGEHHIDLEFVEFTIPMYDPEGDWTHWATCPANGEPLVLRIEEEEIDE